MTYHHFSTTELVMIESYFHQKTKVSRIAERLGRSRTSIYKVIAFLKAGKTAKDYLCQYQKNKQRCGRRKILLNAEEKAYVLEKLSLGWAPDVIVGRKDGLLPCSVRTLYRCFHDEIFDKKSLPMKGKRKPNGHKEKRGKQAFKRNISEREADYPDFSTEFGHIEGDTIVGVHHKSAVITLVERVSKFIITLKPEGRKAIDIEKSLNAWLSGQPRHRFKSITFDCGKEFSNWKSVSNENDVAIYFADPGCPSQRGLNENSNGLLRRDGLPKAMDFNSVDPAFIDAVADKRNRIPRKSLKYRTPLEVFQEYIGNEVCSA